MAVVPADGGSDGGNDTVATQPNTNDDAWPAIGGPKLAFRRQDLTLVLLLQNRYHYSI